MPEFTDDEIALINAMREAVIERGSDYVYDKSQVGYKGKSVYCTYLDYSNAEFNDEDTRVLYDGTIGVDYNVMPTNLLSLPPSCIVGQGVSRSGLANNDFLYNFEGTAARFMFSEFNLGEKVLDAVQVAQNAQDGGASWGRAYSRLVIVLTDAGYNVDKFAL